MESLDLKQTNRLNIIFQSIYELLLIAFVHGSYIIKMASLQYLIGFYIIVIIGFTVIYSIYYKNNASPKLKHALAIVQTIVYLYIMILGHAEFRFALILPILFYLVLYHSVGFIITISLSAIAVNILNVFICIFVFNRVSYDDSARYMIQLTSIICSMVSAAIAAGFYNREYIRNVTYTSELEQMNLSTIETIANTIDAKDPYTQGHSRRVADYSVLIARKMGYSEAALKDLHHVALLHDVGKIAVPDSVLNKPTRLTNEEFTLMKSHTTQGAEILKNVKNVESLIHGVKYHHERFDGRGYPEGLKGDEIPEFARIIGVADAYDAMTSNRVYRKPLPYDTVISEIKSCRGTQFAPDVVDAFLACVKEEQIVPHTHDEMGSNETEENRKQHIINIDEDRALKDELTGAYQEKYGVGIIEQRLQTNNASLVLFNIVGLRRINQELGFRVGDYYIKMVAQTIIGSQHKPFTVRFNGNQFLCYLDNYDMDETTRFITDCIHRVSALEENDPLMEKSLSLTCAAKVKKSSSKTIAEHIENLEKVLYLLKGKEDVYAWYDSDEDRKHFYDISKDLANLIKAIKDKETDNLSKAMHSNNVDDIINLVRNHPKEEMGIAIFTIKPIDDEHIITVNLDYAIKILEEGMRTVLKDKGSMFYFSSLQRVAIIKDTDKKDDSWQSCLDKLEMEVLNFFHKNYDKIDIEVGFNASVIDYNS